MHAWPTQLLFNDPPPPVLPSQLPHHRASQQGFAVGSSFAEGGASSLPVASGPLPADPPPASVRPVMDLALLEATVAAPSARTAAPSSRGGPLRSFSAMSGPVDFGSLGDSLLLDDGERSHKDASFRPVNPAAVTALGAAHGALLRSSTSGSESASLSSDPALPSQKLGHVLPTQSADESDCDTASPLLRFAAPPGFSRPRRFDRAAVLRAAASEAAAVSSRWPTPPVDDCNSRGSSSAMSSPAPSIGLSARPPSAPPDQLTHHNMDGSQPAALPAIIVFHCEFSQHRGPDMLRAVRAFDRRLHLHRYPALSFPQLYVLHRGYRHLREEEPSLCVPFAGAYTAMDDPRHRSDVEAHAKERRRGMKAFRALRPKAEQQQLPARRLGEDAAALLSLPQAVGDGASSAAALASRIVGAGSLGDELDELASKSRMPGGRRRPAPPAVRGQCMSSPRVLPTLDAMRAAEGFSVTGGAGGVAGIAGARENR